MNKRTIYFIGAIAAAFSLVQVIQGFTFNLQGFPGMNNSTTLVCGVNMSCVQDSANNTITVNTNSSLPCIDCPNNTLALKESSWDAKGNMNYSDTRSKIGSFYWDLSTTGTESVADVGFRPTSGFFMTDKDLDKAFSFGFASGNQQRMMEARDYDGADTWAQSDGILLQIVVPNGNGYIYFGSFDSNGFTFTKGKNGNPAGVVLVYYIVFR